MKQSDFDNRQTFILNYLKDLNIRGLENMDISHLMFNVSGEALKTTTFKSIKKLLRIVLFSVIGIEYKYKGERLPLLISYDYHREDHTKYWAKFKSIVTGYNEICIEEGRENYCKLRTPKEMVSVLLYYFHIMKKICNIQDLSVRRIIAASLSELIPLKKQLEQFNIHCKSAFIFFDGGKVENLIVQLFRNQGIVVATMQHGQPVFHGFERDRINQTMILNFSSDYIMVTGEYSKKQFLLGGVSKEKIFVGGSLREINKVRTSRYKDFAVFLDCPTNPNAVRDNEELMECAEKISSLLNSRYVIKCHPQDNPLNYRDLSDRNGKFLPKSANIKEALDCKAFGILHASGVYLDIIAEGIKAFCYLNDTEFPLVENGLDSFNSANELIEKIKIWDSYKPNEKQEYLSKVIEYYLSPNNVENRYINFVNKLNMR